MAEKPDPLTAEQRKFLTDVLGLNLPVPTGDADVGKVLPIWTEARETTGQQISALQSHLQGQKLPLFRKIADAGLHGVTDGQFNKLQAALMDFDAASGPAVAAASVKAQAAIAAMRGFLGASPVLPLLERNPFGISVSLRDTLGSALDRIERIVGAA